MGSLFRNFPYTVLLGLTGILLGAIIPLSINYFVEYQISGNLGQDPITTLFTYFNEYLAVIFKGIVLAGFLGLIFAFIGFIIDNSRKRY